jgi:hypothetical protein
MPNLDEPSRELLRGIEQKIFEVVPGSNQRLIQPQTVGKNEGAPII